MGTDANATPVTAASATLTYGSLVLSSNGTYTYTLNNANPTVNALNVGQSLTDSYTYTLTDGSANDTSTLDISVTPQNDNFSDGNESITVLEDSSATTGIR